VHFFLFSLRFSLFSSLFSFLFAFLFSLRLTNQLSSRPERPDFFFRAALWRVGPRSGGIVAPPPRLGTVPDFRFSLFESCLLIADNLSPLLTVPPQL